MRRAAWVVMLVLWSASIAAWSDAWMRGDQVALLFVLVQLHGLALGVLNEWQHTEADHGRGAWLVPVLYTCGAFVAPIGATAGPGRLLLACAAGLVVVVRSFLGRGFTFGGSTWCGLVDRGAYAFVRHPLIALELLLRGLVLVVYCSWWNVGAVAVYLMAMCLVIRVEEGWLWQFAEYRRYADRVTWRLLPGVW